jgi:hypothetical protein
MTRPPLRLLSTHRGLAWFVIGLMFLAAAVVTITLAGTMTSSWPLIVGAGELLAAVGCFVAALRQPKNQSGNW